MTRLAQSNSRHQANAIKSVARCLTAVALSNFRDQPAPETIIKRNWPRRHVGPYPDTCRRIAHLDNNRSRAERDTGRPLPTFSRPSFRRIAIISALPPTRLRWRLQIRHPASNTGPGADLRRRRRTNAHDTADHRRGNCRSSL
jgi:hypothetical protein